MLEIDQDLFNQNLLLTQAYCEMQLINVDKSPAAILRSFNPIHNGKPIYAFQKASFNNYSWNTTILSEIQQMTRAI